MTFICPTNVLFECSRCGLCCGDTTHKKRHILLLESETNAISAETRLSKQEFAKPVTDRNPYCYEMKKSREGKCYFLKDNQCIIYALRPLICRFYPFELKFEVDKHKYVFSFTVECPGINRGRTMINGDFEDLFLFAQKRLP